ncbi:MAG: diaminopimelate epimerase [Lachnospiraceae bacterium]|nr:diaminopimelate epimerase [Lachnospiraceae bacterium]
MKFTKMHGCGNDYVYVDCTESDIDNPEKVAVFVSDRHFGIGSDGLILIKKSLKADFEMVMYNADGSRGEMCGNGIRCVGKYVYDRRLTNKTEVTVETLAGTKTLKLNVEDGVVRTVRVNMGYPELAAAKVPVTFPEKEMIDKPLEVHGDIYRVTCVSMGNPHCVTFLEKNVNELDLTKVGPAFEKHPIFPKRTNTEFCNVLDRQHIRMRVWERGSGETLACGTGACAAAVAGVLNGLTDNTVDLELKGGHLAISYDRDENQVFMTGPATFVYDGEIRLPSDLEEVAEDLKIYTRR